MTNSNTYQLIVRLSLCTCLLIISTCAHAQQATGLIIDAFEYERSSLKQAALNASDYADLPEAASIKPWCPLPGNQLQLQTSAGWAAAYGAMTILEAKRKKMNIQYATIIFFN